MKILHRLMLKQFLGPFVVAFFVVVFALVMQNLWKYVDDLIGKGLPMTVIGELLLYTAVWLSNMAFPLAILLASIFTLGNMGENYELIALKSAGISLQRILFPLIILSVFLSTGAFFFANNVVPVAFLEWRALMYDIRQQRPELRIQEEIFYNEIEGYSIRFSKRDIKTNMLYDMRIYDHTKQMGNVRVILADSGQMRITPDKGFLELELFHGRSYEDMVEERRTIKPNKNYPFQHHYFDREIFRIALPNYDFERSDVQNHKSGYKMLNLPQLTTVIDSFSNMITTQEDQLRLTVKPVYQQSDLRYSHVDTTLRAKIPDNFWSKFHQMPKSKRQTAIQEAVSSVRSQKDQIAGLIYELDSKGKQTRLYKIEWHRILNIAIACFIFFFIGAPLGAIIRKGGVGTPIIIAVLFFVIYYVISMIGERSAKEGAMTPFEGMWMSTFIILVIGVFLTWMATRDSSIFNQELYISYIKKGLNFVFATHWSSRPEIEYQPASTDLSPENILAKLEDLSLLCKTYLEGDFRKNIRFRKIWYEQDDQTLSEIGRKYDHIRSVLKQSDVEMIRETVEEYPYAALHNYQIKKVSHWQVVATVVIFPVWVYLFLKTWIQKYSLRNELRNIMGANRNLVNELNSIL